MRIYWVRHGESEANIRHEFSNRGMKHPLTDRGVAQAEALAEELTGMRWTRVYSSPILRALQTTQIVCEALGIRSFQVEEDLREYDVGILEGRTAAADWDTLNALEEAWNEPLRQQEKMESGESFVEIQARFTRFATRLQRENPKDSNILVVAHGGLLKVGLPGVLDNVSYEFALTHRLGNCELVVAELSDGGLKCISWGQPAGGTTA